MTSEELDRLAELHKRRRASQCAWEEFTDEVLLAFPALLAAARETEEFREWQRDAVQWLEDMRGVCVEYGDFDGKRDIDELLTRVKP